MDCERDRHHPPLRARARLRRRRPRVLVRLRQAHAADRRAHERVRARLAVEPVRSRSSATCRSRRSRGRSRAAAALEQYVLTMQPGTAEILPGLQDAGPRLRRAAIPGPTIKATRGRAVEVRQVNQSGRSLNVHLHGGVTRPEFDGHPHDAIPNGTERLYKYPNVQRPATLWYHDHAHGETAQDAVRRPRRVLPARRPGRRRARAAAGRLRRPADDPGPQLQRRRLLPLPGRPRPRLPRRHDPGQRRRRAADEGRAAAVPAALPQRGQRARLHARRWATTGR